MIDWQFWLAAGGMTVVVSGLMLLGLRAGRDGDATAAYDLQVYRDQLKEVDRDLARGMIGAEEAGRLRTEVARRVLEADRAVKGATPAAQAPRWAGRIAVGGIVAAALGALAMYADLGAPGYPDMPIAERYAAAKSDRDNRPHQAALEAKTPTPDDKGADPQFLDLMAKLRTAVQQRPDDLRGQQLLAENEAKLAHYPAAWRAQAEVIRLKGDQATAQDYATQAALMILATRGEVAPEADAPLLKALQLDPKNGTARYYMGLMFLQTGRPDLTFQLWAPLLNDSPADAPWVAPIRSQIETVAELAGVTNFSLPDAAAPGPGAADLQAAAGMTPEARQQMIRGMVEQLATRLDSQGGSADEWVRLIRAYGVLGEADKQKAALAKAETAFANAPDDLAKVQAAAQAPAPGTPPQGGVAGPSAGDVAAAQDMSPADRQAMIAGMVGKLADRLDTQGGTAAQWAQLINAYAVLGQTDKAKDAWAKAKAAMAGNPADMDIVRAAAEKAGVAG